jgi:hypothetical protein
MIDLSRFDAGQMAIACESSKAMALSSLKGNASQLAELLGFNDFFSLILSGYERIYIPKRVASVPRSKLHRLVCHASLLKLSANYSGSALILPSRRAVMRQLDAVFIKHLFSQEIPVNQIAGVLGMDRRLVQVHLSMQKGNHACQRRFALSRKLISKGSR